MQRMPPNMPPRRNGGTPAYAAAVEDGSPALRMAERIRNEQGPSRAREYLAAMEPYLAPGERRHIAERLGVELPASPPPQPAQQPPQNPFPPPFPAAQAPFPSQGQNPFANANPFTPPHGGPPMPPMGGGAMPAQLMQMLGGMNGGGGNGQMGQIMQMMNLMQMLGGMNKKK